MEKKHLYSCPCFDLLLTQPLAVWGVRVVSVCVHPDSFYTMHFSVQTAKSKLAKSESQEKEIQDCCLGTWARGDPSSHC